MLSRVDEIKITVVGRSSGRKITLPVWFASDDRALYLLPVKGSASPWYRNLLKNRKIALGARGARWTVRKVTVIKSRSRVRKIADMFRERYGASDVKKYYSKFDVAVGLPLG
ncbi:MAG TPA: nitroreductase/quinone reductase family protein [Candidatus Bathyarchaeia archaeon]|nr:nitroreductase/quinone reductase family protein [Candidatus Bathyarchaeia archaeon]